MSNTKNRLLQFIDTKGISKREFCRRIDVSHTFLNSDSEIGSDKLESIFSVFPDISADWLLTGRGAMLGLHGGAIPIGEAEFGGEVAGRGANAELGGRGGVVQVGDAESDSLLSEALLSLRATIDTLSRQLEARQQETDRLLQIIEVMGRNHADALDLLKLA